MGWSPFAHHHIFVMYWSQEVDSLILMDLTGDWNSDPQNLQKHVYYPIRENREKRD
jgi:hypothetical protein